MRNSITCLAPFVLSLFAACGGGGTPPASEPPPAQVGSPAPESSTALAEECASVPGECSLACNNYKIIMAERAASGFTGEVLSPDACIGECGANASPESSRSWACFEKSATSADYDVCQARCQQ